MCSRRLASIFLLAVSCEYACVMPLFHHDLPCAVAHADDVHAMLRSVELVAAYVKAVLFFGRIVGFTGILSKLSISSVISSMREKTSLYG